MISERREALDPAYNVRIRVSHLASHLSNTFGLITRICKPFIEMRVYNLTSKVPLYEFIYHWGILISVIAVKEVPTHAKSFSPCVVSHKNLAVRNCVLENLKKPQHCPSSTHFHVIERRDVIASCLWGTWQVWILSTGFWSRVPIELRCAKGCWENNYFLGLFGIDRYGDKVGRDVDVPMDLCSRGVRASVFFISMF